MKTLRTAGIVLGVALAAVGLAVLPAVEPSPGARPGIVVGEEAPVSDAGGTAPALPGDVPESAATGSSSSPEPVALPTPSAGGQPDRGAHPDSDVSGMEYEASPSPAPAPIASDQARSGGTSSSAGGSGSTGGSSSGGGNAETPTKPAAPKKPATPPKPAGTCEWDDDGWECEDDDDDDDDDDGDDDDEDDDD